MKFIRTRDAQGLPKDYPLKPHHRAGFVSFVTKEFRHRVRDADGHYHGKINIRVLK